MLNQTPTLVQAASGNADQSVAGDARASWSACAGPADPAKRCLAVIATEREPG